VTVIDTRQPFESTAATHKIVRFWVASVAISVYGPYVVSSARTEQIMVFLSAFAILLFGWPLILGRRSSPPMPVIIVWCELYSIIILATIFPHIDLGTYGQQPPLHAFADFALPLALIIVTWFWTLIIDVRYLMILIARITVAGMAANTVVAICQVVTNNVEVFSALPHFWSGPAGNAGSAIPVAVAAAGNGRFTGIFNQPAEAGVAYGVALFCLIFLTQVSGKSWTTIRIVLGVALTVGGILSISKMFLIGGLPISLILLLKDHKNRFRAIAAIAAIASCFWLLGANHLLPTWAIGPSMLRNLVYSNSSTITTATAGRYGPNSSLGPLAIDIVRSSPWVGFGAGGVAAPYDSMWVEALAVSGIFGVILIVCVFILLFGQWLRLRGILPRPERQLSGAALLLAFGGSFGLPTLTGNRVSTLLWLIIGTLIVSQAGSRSVSSAWRALPHPQASRS
jgi:hypothetical protein